MKDIVPAHTSTNAAVAIKLSASVSSHLHGQCPCAYFDHIGQAEAMVCVVTHHPKMQDYWPPAILLQTIIIICLFTL